MVQSLHHSRQPQYSEGVNIKLNSLKEGAAPQDKHALRVQIHNQQSYLRSEQEQKRPKKQYQIDVATQLAMHKIDQDALGPYYEPYSIVISGDDGTVLQTAGESE